MLRTAPTSQSCARVCRPASGRKTMKRAQGNPCRSWLPFSRPARVAASLRSPADARPDRRKRPRSAHAGAGEGRPAVRRRRVRAGCGASDRRGHSGLDQQNQAGAMIFWGIIAILAAIIASAAEPADLPVVFSATVVAIGALALVFAFM